MARNAVIEWSLESFQNIFFASNLSEWSNSWKKVKTENIHSLTGYIGSQTYKLSLTIWQHQITWSEGTIMEN